MLLNLQLGPDNPNTFQDRGASRFPIGGLALLPGGVSGSAGHVVPSSHGVYLRNQSCYVNNLH